MHPPQAPLHDILGNRDAHAQVRLLMGMRLTLVRRNMRAVFFQAVLPAILLTVGLSLQHNASFESPDEPQALQLTPGLYGGDTVPVYQGNNSAFWSSFVAALPLEDVSVNSTAALNSALE